MIFRRPCFVLGDLNRSPAFVCSSYGYTIGDHLIPFLRLARRGRRRPDGTKESNAYHIGWLPLIAVVAEQHWNPKLKAEALAILHSTLTQKVVNE